MSKNAIFALVVGLIVGGLAIWLMFGLTDVGTMIINYQGTSKQTEKIGQEEEQTGQTQSYTGYPERVQEYTPWTPDTCDTEMIPEDYNVTGDLNGVEFDINGNDITFTMNWDVFSDIPLQCVKAGSTLRVEWWRIGISDPPFSVPTEMFHEETISLPHDSQTMVTTTSYQNLEMSWPAISPGIQQRIYINDGTGERELASYCSLPYPTSIDVDPISGDVEIEGWEWIENQSCEFDFMSSWF